MLFEPADYVAIALAFVLGVLLTAGVRALSRRVGMVAKPRADRWHTKPTALMGGLAIFGATALVFALFLPHDPKLVLVMIASMFLGLVGLIDDLVHLKPYQKLFAQLIGSAVVISGGLELPWTDWPAVNLALTVFWLIGITNGVNLLDNMDGLAGGVVAIAASFLAVHFLLGGQPAEATLMAVFVASLLGFLVFNVHPASIFMGDCGSLFIGFLLASAALLTSTGGRSTSLLPILAVPVLTLLIPIFDTTFVTVLRKLAGRSVSQGGRDHTSHRLVALGMSERRAVGLLYGLAALSGLLALFVRGLSLDMSLAAIAAFTIVLTLLGVYLAGVKVYTEEELHAANKKPLVTFLVHLSYKRRVFEIFMDSVLIVLCYYLANVLLFGPLTETASQTEFLTVLPILVIVKLGAFLFTGVYRGLWRYMSVDSVILHAKAVALGSALSALILLFAFRFEGLSRAAFALDAVLLFGCLSGSRFLFRVFRSLLPMASTGRRRRVLIYGAGDAGELLLRELRNNEAHLCQPIGLLDDDPLKKGAVIHGLPVLGGNGSFQSICRDRMIDEVIISSGRFSEERIAQIRVECGKAKVALKRLRLEIEQLREHEES